jgi:hypothetical protein
MTWVGISEDWLEGPAMTPQGASSMELGISEARAAETLPWDRESARLYRTIFPQMTLSLPDEEAAQLRFEFDTEMARLEAA